MAQIFTYGGINKRKDQRYGELEERVDEGEAAEKSR